MITNNFKIFSGDLGNVRCVVDDRGEGWFLRKDVCDALSITNPSEAYMRAKRSGKVADSDSVVVTYKSCKDKDCLDFWGKIRTGENDFSDKAFVSEAGLYALIFSGEKKSAIEFQRWVLQEVLPAINKDGGYVLGQEFLSDKDKEELKNNISSMYKKTQDKITPCFGKEFSSLSESADSLSSEVSKISARVAFAKNISELEDGNHSFVDAQPEIEDVLDNRELY